MKLQQQSLAAFRRYKELKPVSLAKGGYHVVYEYWGLDYKYSGRIEHQLYNQVIIIYNLSVFINNTILMT
jgi:hypothetical protein